MSKLTVVVDDGTPTFLTVSMSGQVVALKEETREPIALVASRGPAGRDGNDGADSTVPGPPGDKGDKGDPGAPGQGVPAGGSAGQVLAKSSGADYATAWINPPTPTTPGAPTYVASVSGTGAPVWAHPAAVAAGDLAFIFVSQNAGDTVTAPSGWTQLGKWNNTEYYGHQTVAFMRTVATAGASQTFTITGTQTAWSVMYVRGANVVASVAPGTANRANTQTVPGAIHLGRTASIHVLFGTNLNGNAIPAFGAPFNEVESHINAGSATWKNRVGFTSTTNTGVSLALSDFDSNTALITLIAL